jgi:hypothetical protein
MLAKRLMVGLLFVAGLVSGCGGAEAEAQDTAPVSAENLSRCEAGCYARYNLCVTRAIEPLSVCRDERISCVEQCELMGLEVPEQVQQQNRYPCTENGEVVTYCRAVDYCCFSIGGPYCSPSPCP